MRCVGRASDEHALAGCMIERELTWLASSDGSYWRMHGRSVIGTFHELQASLLDWVRDRCRVTFVRDSITYQDRSTRAGVGMKVRHSQRRTRDIAF